MIDPIATLLALVSIVVMLASFVVAPQRACCPPGWHHNGIRPTGQFACTRAPVGDPDWDGTWQRPERSHVPAGEIRGRLRCANRTHPLVRDERCVGCQR